MNETHKLKLSSEPGVHSWFQDGVRVRAAYQMPYDAFVIHFDMLLDGVYLGIERVITIYDLLARYKAGYKESQLTQFVNEHILPVKEHLTRCAYADRGYKAMNSLIRS